MTEVYNRVNIGNKLTYPEGEVQGQRDGSKIGAGEGQSLGRKQVFYCTAVRRIQDTTRLSNETHGRCRDPS